MTISSDGVVGWRPAVPSSVVGLLGLAIGCLLALRLLVPAGWNPSVFLALGEESTLQTEYAQRALGEVVTRELQGHDGKFFFIQAVDPFYLDPDRHAAFLDRPRYRAQRMLFPLVAGLGGLAPPAAIPWAMAVTSILALGAGSWLTAEIARLLGGSPWLGLAFALNLGVISELFIGGAGILALALGVGAVWALMTGRLGWAVSGLTAAALTREVMLLFALGLAVALWRVRGVRTAMGALLFPAGAVTGWWLYLSVRLGHLAAMPAVQEIDVSYPFAGLADAARHRWEGPLDLVFGGLLVAVLVFFTIRVLERPTYLGWGSLGFVALAAVLSGQVWGRYFDISRALAPVLTAYVVTLFTSGTDWPGSREQDAV